MPTSTITAENKAQDMKMNIPVPPPCPPISKAVENYATANNTTTGQDLNSLFTQTPQVQVIIFHWDAADDMLDLTETLRSLFQTRLNPTSLTNSPTLLVANRTRRFVTTIEDLLHVHLPFMIMTV
jgi:hypothetical protein